MDNNDLSNNETDRDMAETRHGQDFDDLQNEIAGRETGRNSRFLSKGNAEAQETERKKNHDRVQQTALDILLQNNPEYAALYNETMDLIRRAEIQAEQFLRELESGLSSAQDTMKETLDNANKLPDGTAVFKDADGNVWTADGRKVGPEEAAGIEWKKGGVSYEDYLKQKQAIEDFKRQIDEVHHYQVDVLGRARDRMTDPDNPPSMDDIKGISQDIQHGLDKIAQDKISIETHIQNTHTNSAEITMPKIGG